VSGAGLALKPAVLLELAVPLGLAVVGFGAGLLLRRTLFARLARLAAGTRSKVDDLVISALRGPVVLACAVAGLYAGLEVAALPPAITRVLERSALALVLFVVSWAGARLAAAWVHAKTAEAHGTLPSATLLPNLARTTVLVLGILVVLETLGIQITPIITALGIGGLAVALALQDTLANLFAGIQILLSHQVRPGDFVRLGSGEEGYVQDVTWRYTTIRQLPNNITVVPNSKLASAITTNYYLPERELSVLVQVGVAYSSDLDRVERVTIEVGREVMRDVQGGVATHEPFIRYHTFGDSSINFSVILRGKEFTDRYLLTHEFIKRLHRRYREEGIEIPFPMRTVEIRGGGLPGAG
jgi:small-conductance mechanosensitive channel